MLHVALALTFIAAQAIDSPATTRELTEIVQRLRFTDVFVRRDGRETRSARLSAERLTLA